MVQGGGGGTVLRAGRHSPPAVVLGEVRRAVGSTAARRVTVDGEVGALAGALERGDWREPCEHPDLTQADGRRRGGGGGCLVWWRRKAWWGHGWRQGAGGKAAGLLAEEGVGALEQEALVRTRRGVGAPRLLVERVTQRRENLCRVASG